MISVIIPYADRSQEQLRYVCDIILNAGADEIVISNTGKARLGWDGKVKEVHVPIERWYPALARNIGANITRGDKLIFALADTFCASPSVFRAFADVPVGIIRTAKDCTVLNADQSRAAMRGAREFKGPERYMKGFLVGALMAINRQDYFNRVRGWDAELEDWGYNDRDFLARCKASGMRHELFDIQMMHLWHERRLTEHHEDNRKMSERKLRSDWWGYKNG